MVRCLSYVDVYTDARGFPRRAICLMRGDEALLGVGAFVRKSTFFQ